MRRGKQSQLSLTFPADRSTLRVIRSCWVKTNGHALGWDMRANAKRLYHEHAQLVRDRAPSGRFLEYDPEQGWEPLCQFLNLPIPAEPFPRGNVAQEFHQRIEGAMKPRIQRGMRKAAVVTATAIGFGVAAYLQRAYISA